MSNFRRRRKGERVLASIQGIFKRYEKKYLLNPEQMGIVVDKILEYMELDEYGLSTICSIYFDTENSDLIRRSIEKPAYKEKLRLRCYGKQASGSDTVFVELKKKYNGIVYKRRIVMSYDEAVGYLTKGHKAPVESQISREIDYMLKFYNPKPAVMVCYDRLAYYGIEDSEFRVTFDLNVRCRSDELDLAKGDRGERIVPEGYAIMEIKTKGAIPLWLCDILSSNKIYPTSFSKYGTYYKRLLEARQKADEKRLAAVK